MAYGESALAHDRIALISGARQAALDVLDVLAIDPDSTDPTAARLRALRQPAADLVAYLTFAAHLLDNDHVC